eukprot:PITA_30964
MEWPIPKDVADIRSFMGLAGYYRRFVEGFSRIAYPITSLQKKGKVFKWIAECQQSFDRLKHLLTTAPILSIAAPNKDYVVCTDASKEGVGGVLMQEGKVIAYESRKLKEHEQKYSAYDLELTTVIHALKMWRHYLLGRKFLLLTDHHSLTNYFSQPTLNARQGHWADFLSGFDFEIKHLKGKENRVADALSRKVQCLCKLSVSKWRNSLFEQIKAAANQDAEYQQIKQQVQQSDNESLQQGYTLDNAGMLYFNKKLYVPNSNNLKNLILDEFHTSHYTGHPGYQKMVTALRKDYFWPRMKKLHGLPKVIISDRDVKFTSTFWRTLFAELGTQLNFSTAYHPQTDGQTERVNQVLEDMLRAYVMTKPTQWEEYLHLVEFAYNNGYHTSTKLSPFEVLYGRKCRTPSSWGGPEDKLSLGPKMLKEMEDMVKKVSANLKAAQDWQKSFADRKRRFKEYQIGDHVFVRIQARRSTLQWSGCAKLAPRYFGPFQILARVGPVAYQLALPSHIRIHNVFHISVLKKYVYDPKHVIKWQDVQVEPEGEVLVEPQSILDRREVRLRKRVITQIKVLWQHYGPEEATWEDEEIMRKVYPDLFNGNRHRDDVQSQGGRCDDPVKTCNYESYYGKKLM